MNNIYKVIWSKAKNCYVVASEIARSHTKSATGSGKIGGVTRRSLLASLMALSLLCGGLGVVSASLEVVDQSGTPGTVTIYTKDEVDHALTAKGAATDVAKNTADIAANKDNINKLETNKLDKDVANSTFATKDALNDLTTTVSGKADEAAVTTALDSKADTDLSNLTAAGETKIKDTMSADMDLKANKADVNTALDGKADKATVTDLATKVGDASSGLVKDVADLKTQGNDLNTAIGNKADQSALVAATDRITTNETNISALQTKTTGLSADGKSLNGMNSVETDALTVKGEIKNGAGVTTTLTDIKASMDKANANETAIGQLQTTTTDQQTAIDKLKEKTADISHMAGGGTNISGVTIKDGNILGNGNSAITGLTNVETGSIKTDSINGKSLTGTNVATEKNVADAVKTETDARIAADNALEGKINDEKTAREAADAKINTKIGNIDDTRTVYVKDANSISQNLTTLDEKLQNTNDRTGGIKRNTEDTQTTIENKVTVNGSGDVDGVKGLSAETINTTGDAGIGGKLNVTGASDLKGDVTLGTPNGTNTVTVNGTADFNAAVKMNNGLNVTNGETNLKNTTVDGDLKVTGTITTDKMVFGDKATNNYTEIDKGHITSKNDVLAGDATKKSSSMELDHSKLEVGVADKDSNGHLTMTADQTSIKNSDLDGKNYSEIVADKDSVKTTVKDEKGNTTSTKSSATEIRNYAKDKDGNKTNNVQTATQNKSWAKDKDGNESSIVQTGKDITNTAEKGTITNTAKDIVNNATGDMKNDVGGKLTTTVAEQATENFNGGLDTTVTGTEKHTVNGKQINTVTEGQENIISGGQTNTITGGQINNITGDQTTTVTDGNISNTAKNITNAATETLTDKVGTNTRVTTSTSITDTVGTANRKIEDGKIIDTAGDSTVTTENGKGTTFAKTTSAAYSTKAGAPMDTNIAGNHITTGRVDANELGVSDEDGANTADFSVKAGEGVKASAGDGNTKGSLDVTAEEVGSTVKDASGKGSTFKQRIDKIMMESKDVSIKAEETLTNEAKVITNKASEVINNEAVNINNTATGIITSKASEIKNQADKLISNKVGENTWENMENGKITTSIKDGAKQNLTQSNAAGTTQSTVDGGKSTVTIQNADGLTHAVNNGTSINASATTATSSAQTILSGSKANSVITTIDGTQFVNSEAAAPVTGASGANPGTADRTTIKGNTITTGKVTMDYADVMRDLGVHGNAKVDQNLEVGGTSTLKGDVTMESNATVKKDLKVEGTTTTKTLKVTENAEIDGTLKVAKKATFEDSVSIAKDLSVGGDVTAKSYKVGDKTYIDANGINANDQKITNVADGSISEGSKDAVNGGQLYGVKRDLEHQVDKVGANAAAMANLRPMEFDPSSKWNIAAAIGNYGSETAAALGAFYRPNDDVMVNLSTAFGTGENMVGGGVSVRLGKGGNKLSREENNALKAQVDDLTARMDALLSVLNPNMSKDFPDVPENHWAYEAVSRLAGNDIVQGYPDGEFHGERTMTRYEMAEIIYNALSRGAEAERELVEEFKPELQAMAASEKATAEKAEG